MDSATEQVGKQGFQTVIVPLSSGLDTNPGAWIKATRRSSPPVILTREDVVEIVQLLLHPEEQDVLQDLLLGRVLHP